VNVVEIIVMSKNMAKAGFAEAEGDARSFGGAVTKVGGLAGAALVGIGVEAVKMGASFEAEMTKLTTQAGVSQGEMGKLNSGVLKLAGSIGVDPNSLAESLFHVESNFESMGITSDKALSLVATAAKGAKIGGADMVDVTNALTAAVASGIPGVQNFDQAMGALNATVGVGDMSMQDLAQAFGTGMVASVKGYGLSITDVGAALAVFGDNNIRGAKAGTQLRLAVQSLAVPAATGKAALEKLGLSQDTLAKDMQTGGLNKAITDLHTRMDKMGISASQQGEILTEMFGKKAGTGVQILLGQYDRLESKYPALAEGAGNFGKAWEGTQKTMKQRLDEIEYSFKALMITIGEKLIPVVESVLGYLSSHKAIFEVLVVVVGVMLVGAFTAWAVSVIAATWEIILIVAAIALVVAGIYELVKHWSTVWSYMKQYAADFGHWMWDFFVQWLFHDGLEAAWNAVWGAMAAAWNWVKQAASDFGHWMWDFFVQWLFNDGLKAGFNAVVNFFVAAWNMVQAFFIGQWNILKAAWGMFTGALSTAWNTLVGWIKTAWNTASTFVTTTWNGVVGAFRTTISTITGFFTGLWGAITKGVKDAVDAVGRTLGGMVTSVKGIVDKVTGMINKIPGVGVAKSLLGFAAGGIVGHAAEGGLKGNFVQMNERGGEIVSLPTGSKVYSHEDTRRYIEQNSGGGGGRVVIEIRSSGANVDDMLLEILRRAIRIRGGDAQVVLAGG
jgi:TP901 family phage tail tape measure protein